MSNSQTAEIENKYKKNIWFTIAILKVDYKVFQM